MTNSQRHNLTDLLRQINNQCTSKEFVTVDDMLKVIGRRSFGPVLVLVGVFLSTPVIGDIPGAPVVSGALIILIASQLIIKRKHIWIPNFILKKNISKKSLLKMIDWVKVPARHIDKLIKPRLTHFTGRTVSFIILLVAVLLSLATPAMELVPLSANLAGAIFLLFGLSLIAKDGLLALFGFMATLALGALLLYFVI